MPSDAASDCGSRHRSRIPSGEALKKPAGCGSIDAVSGLVYQVGHQRQSLAVSTATPCFGRRDHRARGIRDPRDKCSPSSLTSCSSCSSQHLTTVAPRAYQQSWTLPTLDRAE